MVLPDGECFSDELYASPPPPRTTTEREGALRFSQSIHNVPFPIESC